MLPVTHTSQKGPERPLGFEVWSPTLELQCSGCPPSPSHPHPAPCRAGPGLPRTPGTHSGKQCGGGALLSAYSLCSGQRTTFLPDPL